MTDFSYKSKLKVLLVMRRVFLIDDDAHQAAQLADAIRRHHFYVDIEPDRSRALRALRQRTPMCDLVVVVGRNAWVHERTALRELVETAHCNHSAAPSFLFVSRLRYEPHIRLEVERLGVRYVRV